MLRNIFVASHVYEMSGAENKMKTVVYSTLYFITVRLECKKDVFFNNKNEGDRYRKNSNGIEFQRFLCVEKAATFIFQM